MGHFRYNKIQQNSERARGQKQRKRIDILIHFLAMMNCEFLYVENGLSAFQLNLLERCTGIEEVSQLG